MYRGKTYDSFAYAVNTLFYRSGIIDVPSPDSISHRTLAFSSEPYADECFKIVLKWQEYMPFMLKNLGIQNGFVLHEAHPEYLEQLQIGSVFILGEVSVPEWDMTVINRFCKDICAFLVCEKTSSNFIVSNPLGAIYIEADQNEMMSIINHTDAFIFFFDRRPELNPVSVDVLLKQVIEMEKNFNYISLQNLPVTLKSTKEKTSFQYRLVNYIINRTQTAEFYGMSKKFFSALSDIPVKKDFSEFEKIVQAEDIFWNELKCLQKELCHVE